MYDLFFFVFLYGYFAVFALYVHLWIRYFLLW